MTAPDPLRAAKAEYVSYGFEDADGTEVSVFRRHQTAIRINVGGLAITKTPQAWHALAAKPLAAAPPWFLPNAKRLRDLASGLNNIMPAFDSSQPVLDEAARILRALAADTPTPPATSLDSCGLTVCVTTDGWRPIETADSSKRCLGVVDGLVRVIAWGKTSHVPMYGWCLADQGAEDFDLCKPTHWMPLPQPPDATPSSHRQDEPESSAGAPLAHDALDAKRLLRMVLDDIDICTGEAGLDWSPSDLSQETVEALLAYRK